ncbi:DUF4199 domain-containing protein [Maribellus sp. CM-23]|uniref:DUF4199 domain-containing protein n=1 Tax=Maribellus sp. CM-23 TaxID=2781026 RepID=UPI001F345026|nr:DUF4199 domain-containing protein [Maribellus sp. CM-23]MCE4564360.1 DUF4199 domain-containing protein [Maribellus sp. CM-23]
MEEQKPASLLKSSLTSGIYIGVALILISVILYVAGLMFETWAQYVSWPILLGGAVWAQLAYRKSLGGEMTYGQALGVGVLALIFASVLSSIYAYLLYAVIDPSLQEQLRILTEQRIIEQGKVPEEQLDMVVGMATKFQKPAILAAFGILGGAFVGLIISLITAIFTKKNPSDLVPE